MAHIIAEYLWIDGSRPTAQLRSKARVLPGSITQISDLPEWGFDGSSTEQAEGHASDCRLRPVFFVKDPMRGGENVLVLCEVFTAKGEVHPSNTRVRLRELAMMHAGEEAWFGIEQEYTLFEGDRPMGWPKEGFPAAQGPYYCSVGADVAFGRDIVEDHLRACLDVGIGVCGINAEVMPGQWEFQVGPLGPLEVSDHLWVARWILSRIAEDYWVSVRLDPKPMKGDWNGAGAHTNFSTKAMRELGGMVKIEEACRKLQATHAAHIRVYGANNDQRLTGRHETCDINTFRFGISDRGASIRIPMATADQGCGYFEDRRPAANMDPYQVCAALMETVCGGQPAVVQIPLTTSTPAPVSVT